MTEPTLFDSLAFVDRIESLMKDSESVDVEFKSAKGGFPGSFWETLDFQTLSAEKVKQEFWTSYLYPHKKLSNKH